MADRRCGAPSKAKDSRSIPRALDEALRFSARTARWPEGDSGAEGMPPDEIQQHPVGIVADFKLDELPERLRFLGWATYRETETEIVVTAKSPGADPLLLGSWPRSVGWNMCGASTRPRAKNSTECRWASRWFA